MENRCAFLKIDLRLNTMLIVFIWVLIAPAVYSRTTDRIQLATVAIRHWNFSKTDKDAAMWSAMYIASNNKIYIGLCTHGDAANVYEFDIEKEEMRHLSNLTVLLDERGKGIWTNGKIHVRMQELDGYVYFGSFCEDNGPPRIDASSYWGPWWLRIKMATGEVEALSKINSFWGLLGQDMDKERRLIYGLAENGHLYKYYIDKNVTEDLGRVDNWDICRTIFIDDLGRVYGSYPPGRLWRYDPDRDRLFDLEHLRLPVTLESRTMANPLLDRRAQWRIIEWDPETRCAYGIIGGSNMLFRFDVHDGSEGRIDLLTQMCAPMYRGSNPFNVPHATLAMTLSPKERAIYYIPVISGDFDYNLISLDADATRPNKKSTRLTYSGKKPPRSFLVRYDLEKGERRDIGLLLAHDGRIAYGMGGAETDTQGHIWFVGAFEEPDPDYVAGVIGDRFPFSMGLGRYDPSR